MEWLHCATQNLEELDAFKVLDRQPKLLLQQSRRRWLAYLPIPGGGGKPQSCTKTEFCAQNVEFIPAAPSFSSPNPDFSASLNPQHFLLATHQNIDRHVFCLAKQPCQSNPVAQK